MSIQVQMKQFLDETPTVNLVAFGDLSSGLILNWTAKAPCPREGLDLLIAEATADFALLGQTSTSLGSDVALFGASVIHFSEQGTHIFARNLESPDDVICVATGPGGPLEPLLTSTLALVDQIAGPE